MGTAGSVVESAPIMANVGWQNRLRKNTDHRLSATREYGTRSFNDKHIQERLGFYLINDQKYTRKVLKLNLNAAKFDDKHIQFRRNWFFIRCGKIRAFE